MDVNDRNGSPICPQNYVDVGHLLRLPDEDNTAFELEQDEFNCLNLNVSVPDEIGPTSRLPVFVWIHGRSSP